MILSFLGSERYGEVEKVLIATPFQQNRWILIILESLFCLFLPIKIPFRLRVYIPTLTAKKQNLTEDLTVMI